jgi:hypothetical protein
MRGVMDGTHTLIRNNRYTVTEFLEAGGQEELRLEPGRYKSRYKSVTGNR